MSQVQSVIIKGHEVLYSLEDTDLLTQFKWRIGSHGRYLMRGTRIDGKYYNLYFHRFVVERMGLAIQGYFVDHINGNNLDNRRENLRRATSSQNNANSRKPNVLKSGFRGVYWHQKPGCQGGRWVANIQVEKKPMYLGSFQDVVKAAKAYDEAAFKHFGEYAILNFPK